MADVKTPIKVEISHRTIIFTLFVLLALWFLIQIREIIVLIFLSLILLSALLRPVEWLSSKRVPRVLAVLIVYLIVIGLISAAVGIVIPPLIKQTSDFVSKLPQIISTVNQFVVFYNLPAENLSSALQDQFQQIAGNVISISSAIISSIFLIITLFVLTFYLLLEWKNFVRILSSPFSGKHEKKVVSIISKIEGGLGIWVRGQLTLSIIVGVLTYVGLRIIGIPFALPLALIAAILEIIPIIGPIISAIPAILVGLTISPVIGLAVAALFLIVQQLENNLIVPIVMSRVVGLQPPFVIIALLIGAKLAGIGGAFLAVPVIVVAKIIISELINEDQKSAEGISED